MWSLSPQLESSIGFEKVYINRTTSGCVLYPQTQVLSSSLVQLQTIFLVNIIWTVCFFISRLSSTLSCLLTHYSLLFNLWPHLIYLLSNSIFSNLLVLTLTVYLSIMLHPLMDFPEWFNETFSVLLQDFLWDLCHTANLVDVLWMIRNRDKREYQWIHVTPGQ